MKKIGIPAWKIDDKCFGVSIPYINWISKFGNPILILPTDVDNPPKVDLLILPGGLDVNPITYGKIPGFYTQNSNVFLEHFDENILPKYLELNTPIFGICRGAQKLWAMNGGNINQHVNWHETSSYPTHQCHYLYFTEEFSKFGKDVRKVTSRHHQTCNGENTPENLKVIAYAGEEYGKKIYPIDEIVEVFKHKTKPIVGVQYHPEDHDGTDDFTSKIINKLLNNETI